MNHRTMPTYIPILTTEAGSCLTMANWQEVGVNTVSCHLEALLVKPGVSLLSSLPNLKTYIPWEGPIVLNAALSPLKQGKYTIRSPYDGSVIQVSQEEISRLIEKLQPEVVVLPADFNLGLLGLSTKTTKVFTVPEINAEQQFGCYLTYQPSMSFAALQEKIERYNTKPIYLAGDFNLQQFTTLIQYHSVTIESNLPALHAFSGKVYCERGVLDLCAEEMTHQHTVIDTHCKCPICQQQFTRAYLHHLIHQTPLLCQRLLIQHNAYYSQHCC
ncbi:hypothetical protein [Legionella jamestowniensis]|uniref:Queuine tRNA-ribosyltransferase n=2 Tax=Legionella jamestowniensis TaxID=455 RepID=A0A0W0UGM3_9GAMM|nr:hypothetical protein [Legionella jamestowniensis]KTD07000.1 queuine tRNA-ribosyltransferase [Legionella jamestowniensis]SFM03937.1 queuine tRNA-ribosyltransferase [Legionella jamestowniensis DSM 19215]